MIITRTPFRISFFGGGTDYPQWYRENGGSVISTSIDKYCYITCRVIPPFFDHKHRIVYSYIENVREISEIKHPAVKAIFNWAKIVEGLEIHHDADLPARSGLGSSSAFTVGLINALYAYKGELVSKERLSREAINIEQNIIRENVGSQDQISVAYGGFNKIEFNKDDSFSVSPIIIKTARKNELLNHLMLFFTGFSRIADQIAESQIKNMNNKQKELMEIHEMVDQATKILLSEDCIEDFGRLLDKSWQIKRSLSDKISNYEINDIYRKAKDAGAIGGKLLGAGGGGFMLLFVRPENQEKVKISLKNLINVPFSFDNSGSKVVLFQPNGL
jgi:D-glycero-alpha-D-manno-heptose-7-phosphate kinase